MLTLSFYSVVGTRRSVAHSLHKQVLTKNLDSPAPGVVIVLDSPDIFSPAGVLDKLNLNDSNSSAQETDVVGCAEKKLIFDAECNNYIKNNV